MKRNLRTVCLSILLVFIADGNILAQTAVKKVRMGVQPFTVTEIVDYSFLEKARRDLNVSRQ